jgi:hypothetical protein
LTARRCAAEERVEYQYAGANEALRTTLGTPSLKQLDRAFLQVNNRAAILNDEGIMARNHLSQEVAPASISGIASIWSNWVTVISLTTGFADALKFRYQSKS